MGLAQLITALDGIWRLAASALSVPTAVFVGECIAAQFPTPRSPKPRRGGPISTVVVVPAHNEQAVIAKTVAHLLEQVRSQARVLVVADNCDDQTARRARDAGAEVLVRQDRQRRGKGFAIQYALEHLAANAPDVVVVFDADCAVASDSEATLLELAALAHELGRPVQAESGCTLPPNPTPRIVVSALAYLVRSWIRRRGLKRLGLPCHLGGTGMALPWSVLREVHGYHDDLVEDLVMGLDLTRTGYPPYFMHEARVVSPLPERDQAAQTQRRRWEHGHLAALVSTAPRLLLRGLYEGRKELIAQGLDLMVPPLAFLVSLQLLLIAGGACLAWAGASPLALFISGAGLLALCAAVLISWARFARREIPMRFILTVPAYVLWKIPIYLSFLLGRQERNWVRTERRTEQAREPEPRS